MEGETNLFRGKNNQDQEQGKTEERENERRQEWRRVFSRLNELLAEEKKAQEERTGDRLEVEKVSEVQHSEDEILRSRDLVFLPANGECLFIGDLHGDVDSLNAILEETKFQDKLREGQGYLVFLGDYLDRGDQELEVLERLVELKQQYGERVILLRGNHEDLDQMISEYMQGRSPSNRPQDLLRDTRFRKEAESFFDNLPCVLVTGNGICAVHGGIPQMEGNRKITLENLSNLTKEERDQVTWSDPAPMNSDVDKENGLIRVWSPSFSLFESNQGRGGKGKIFSPRALDEFLKSIGANVLIRAHETAQGGHVIDSRYKEKLVTLFSSLAGRYRSEVGTPGYCLVDLSKDINSWEESHFYSVSVEETATKVKEAVPEVSQQKAPFRAETEQPQERQEGAQAQKQGAETLPAPPPEAQQPETPSRAETKQPQERKEEEGLVGELPEQPSEEPKEPSEEVGVIGEFEEEGERLAEESPEQPSEELVATPEQPSEELVVIEEGEEAKGKKEQEEAQRQTKEAKLSMGLSFSGFINFLGDVIFKPIEFLINLFDKTIDFLFMVKNFYDEYLKEDLKKIWKELWK
jgi:hypothetical protein